ncbi:MAG: SAM-dependent methyltransferase [Proteobacteria bacterium]|nr:SAM-dependent methyltransferase [Pseudomonadota bacterium]MBU1417548.1 SAM-dependent methyltransferase [Pseudomonadota bacterium]MBU1453105.1 SAM-dependent methyltransferase [Pseudomonadota bacterium]
MSFKLSKVVPWGRSYDEYISMFSLSPTELKESILGCSDGPASFNSILNKQNGSIVSVDPLYSHTTAQIKKRIDETYETVLEQTRKNHSEFVWNSISSVEELGKIRMAAMNEFIQDFEKGKKEKRYINASLPRLPFSDKEFNIALCSHFLFLYSEQFTEKFHFESIKELCRVAKIVKIFPVLELGSVKSRHLETIINKLEKENYRVQLKKVAYEFQKGGNELLEINN